jgi:hypothetical protein
VRAELGNKWPGVMMMVTMVVIIFIIKLTEEESVI